MLKKLQKTNLKVLFRNRRFYIVLCAVLVYTMIPVLAMLAKLYKTDVGTLSAAFVYFGQAQVNDLYSFDSFGLFYLILFPFAVSLAYSDCNFAEKQYGSDCITITRVGRFNYYTAQWITVFIAGALVIWIPLVIEKLVLMTAIPLDSLKITPFYPLNPYTAFSYLLYWKPLFYNHPYVYFFVYDLITAFFGGIFALLSYALSIHTKMNRFLILTVPGICYIVTGILLGNSYQVYMPFCWIIPPFRAADTKLNYLICGAVVLFLFDLAALLGKIHVRRDEL
ncbi:MAG: hypothetical protein LKE53_08275 [Oscillospiraceae bacterium]|jgi:hypothetical protein|nr:hypothetical protein [Oscillospiraceae bacterium]